MHRDSPVVRVPYESGRDPTRFFFLADLFNSSPSSSSTVTQRNLLAYKYIFLSIYNFKKKKKMKRKT